MLLIVLALLGGIALLVWSADIFVDASCALAKRLGLSTLFIGMVVIGFGTSAPELLISALASYQGSPGIALGNAYGSNICNIGLILGVTALLKPIVIERKVLLFDIPSLLFTVSLSAFFAWEGVLSRLDAVILVLFFAAIMTWSAMRAKRDAAAAAAAAADPDPSEISDGKERGIPFLAAKAVFGLLVLLGSSKLLVWGAVAAAKTFGVSDLVIGLTVVAVGTSLPELASSIAACRKGEGDLALGNILGSNLFNTLAVVGLAGLISPLKIPHETLVRDIPVMGLFTLALIPLAWKRGSKTGSLGFWSGVLLLASFVAYTVSLAIFR